MKKKTAILLIISTFAILFFAFAYAYYHTYYKPNSQEGGAPIYIHRHIEYDSLLDSLDKAGVLINRKSFIRASMHMGLDTTFKPGRYIIDAGLGNKAIIRIFANGWQQPMDFILNGYIHSKEKLAGYLGQKLEADSTEFLKVLQDSMVMESLGFNEYTYLGLFIPNTYELYWTITPEDFLKRMKREYDSFWNESRTAKAATLHLSRNEVSTLAAIVIEETKYEPEMPTIAGVYLNRLRIGMPLQADPTVKYALELEGITRILNKHLKVESPYNTYLHTGLPPGPITLTPPVAIDAVLNHQQHKYLYFCAKETFDGQHNFASSYSEHLKNARAYQRALTAAQKAKKN